jgi:hypothetical protein
MALIIGQWNVKSLHEPSFIIIIQHFKIISCSNYEHYIIIYGFDLVRLREKCCFNALDGVTAMLIVCAQHWVYLVSGDDTWLQNLANNKKNMNKYFTIPSPFAGDLTRIYTEGSQIWIIDNTFANKSFTYTWRSKQKCALRMAWKTYETISQSTRKLTFWRNSDQQCRSTYWGYKSPSLLIKSSLLCEVQDSWVSII